MASVAAVPGAGGRRLAVISGKMSPPRSPRFRGGAGGGLAHCKEFEPVLKLAGGLRRGILAVAKAASSEHPRKLAVRNEPTPATGERPAARRVFGQKAVWLRCSSVEDPPGIFSFVAPSGLFPENSAPRSFQTGSYTALEALEQFGELAK